MDLNAITKRAAGETQIFLKEHGPAILTAAGVAGFLATTYLTGKAVLKSQDRIKALKLKTEEITDRPLSKNFSERQRTQEVGQLWVKEGFQIVRIYGPAIAVGGLSIACVIASHKMQRDREISLIAAYTALDAGFRAYRARIQEELGTEREAEIYRGAPRALREGEEPWEEEEVHNDYEGRFAGPYSKIFDESNVNWSHNPEYNLTFLRSKQNWCNDRLRSRGYIFLNTVLEELGMEPTQAGQTVGWRMNSGHDDFVDFGMYNLWDDNARAFINGQETSILLDFNCDGPIIKRNPKIHELV